MQRNFYTHLSVYAVVQFHLMIFDVVELVVDFHGAVLVAYLGYIRLSFDLKFAPAIVSVNYLQLMMVMVMEQQPIAVNAADEAVVHVILLFFVKIVFAV